MRPCDAQNNNRSHVRHVVHSTASVIRGEVPGIYWVSNLSLGGALLQGRRTFTRGTDLLVLLHLPWHGPKALDAVVAHSRPGNRLRWCSFGITFRHHLGASVRLLRPALSPASRGPREPQVLVVTTRPHMGRRLTNDLGLLGLPARVAPPTRAMDLVREPEPAIHQALLDMEVETDRMLELLRLLRTESPQTVRVQVGARHVFGRSGNGAGSGQAHARLVPPYTLDQLARVLSPVGAA